MCLVHPDLTTGSLGTSGGTRKIYSGWTLGCVRLDENQDCRDEPEGGFRADVFWTKGRPLRGGKDTS